MINIKKHIIHQKQPLKVALEMLNEVGNDLTLFVISDEEKLIGTLTDGDVRRGLLNGLGITESIDKFMKNDFRFISKNAYGVKDIIKAKQMLIDILPVLDEKKNIVKLINFSTHYSYLPIDAVIMAGGEGIRLRPLTDNIPKPLLKVGSKPIMEHLIDRLIRFGIENIQISINYLGDKIIDYFKDGAEKHISISYIKEIGKLGTIGSLGLVNDFKNNHVLVMNSDLLTNIDLEKFFNDYESKNADISVACIPYNVNIPYAILDTNHEHVLGLTEKPTFTYHSNAGIYLIKKEHIKRIQQNKFLNATDLIDDMIADKLKVTYYPVLDYWLDIGKMDDYNKAQRDIQHIKL